MPQLTTRQQQVYDFLAVHIADRGYPPTLQEIARHLKVSGNLGVLRHLEVLERKGLIRRSPGSSRSIVLADRSHPIMKHLAEFCVQRRALEIQKEGQP